MDTKLLGHLSATQVKRDPVICYQVMKSLGHLNVSDSEVIHRMVDFLHLDSSRYGQDWRDAIYGLAWYAIVRGWHIPM